MRAGWAVVPLYGGRNLTSLLNRGEISPTIRRLRQYAYKELSFWRRTLIVRNYWKQGVTHCPIQN